MSEKSFDVIIVGGGLAGLSAALILGRMRREVLLLDTGSPANAVSDAMHGFLAQDGIPPAEVRRIAAAQLDPYENVERRAAAAVSARRAGEGFEVSLAGGAAVWSRRLLLAQGMRYGLPAVEGLSDLWGKHVFHCPYCHGWEVRDRAIAVYASAERSVHQALLLRSLSAEVVLLSAGIEVGGEDRQRLARAGVEVIDDPVERLEPTEDGLRVELAGGRADLDRHALFVQPDLSLASEIGPALGARLTEAGSIQVDETGLTAVPGLYAAGDAGTEVQSVAVAAGSGARAAYALNASLASEAGKTDGRGEAPRVA